jgi:hypothetical protein
MELIPWLALNHHYQNRPPFSSCPSCPSSPSSLSSLSFPSFPSSSCSRPSQNHSFLTGFARLDGKFVKKGGVFDDLKEEGVDSSSFLFAFCDDKVVVLMRVTAFCDKPLVVS